MFLIAGTRKINIKRFNDNQNKCPRCKAFDLNVRISKRYFHVFFVPVFAYGRKSIEIKCNKCNELVSDEQILLDYKHSIRTPFYLYSGLIVILGLVLWISYNSEVIARRNQTYINDPKIGDVYKIKHKEEDSRIFYYLRVCRVETDSVFCYRNVINYPKVLKEVSEADYFEDDRELGFSRQQLQDMLHQKNIFNITRSANSPESFNLVK